MTDHMIIRDFSLARDFRSVDWKASLLFNAMRAALGALVWTGILLAIAVSSNRTFDIWSLLATPFVLFLGYWIFTAPLSMVGEWISRIPFVGLFLIALALPVALGDPLVCLVKRLAPNAIPVEDPPLFSLSAFFWVIKGRELTLSN